MKNKCIVYLEENFAYFSHVIALKDTINEIPNIAFINQDDNYYSIIYNPYAILGEPIEIYSSIKSVYSPSFIMDKYMVFSIVWTSLQAYKETNYKCIIN
jgi:hypothetical protein